MSEPGAPGRGAGLMAMVIVRGLRELGPPRKPFTRNGLQRGRQPPLQATGAPERATERRTPAFVTVPGHRTHRGDRRAHRGIQPPARGGGACLDPWSGATRDGIRGDQGWRF